LAKDVEGKIQESIGASPSFTGVEGDRIAGLKAKQAEANARGTYKLTQALRAKSGIGADLCPCPLHEQRMVRCEDAIFRHHFGGTHLNRFVFACFRSHRNNETTKPCYAYFNIIPPLDLMVDFSFFFRKPDDFLGLGMFPTRVMVQSIKPVFHLSLRLTFRFSHCDWGSFNPMGWMHQTHDQHGTDSNPFLAWPYEATHLGVSSKAAPCKRLKVR